MDQRTCRTKRRCDPSCQEKVAAARRLAAVSLMNDSAPKAELEAALRAAQRAGVTNFLYLRARLLLRAGIPIEWMDCD